FSHTLCPSYVSSLSLSTFTIFFFFFNAPPTTEIYTLSLHDALPILIQSANCVQVAAVIGVDRAPDNFDVLLRHRPSSISRPAGTDRKSTRLNSSHVEISYAVFCLKKKKKKKKT